MGFIVRRQITRQVSIPKVVYLYERIAFRICRILKLRHRKHDPLKTNGAAGSTRVVGIRVFLRREDAVDVDDLGELL